MKYHPALADQGPRHFVVSELSVDMLVTLTVIFRFRPEVDTIEINKLPGNQVLSVKHCTGEFVVESNANGIFETVYWSLGEPKYVEPFYAIARGATFGDRSPDRPRSVFYRLNVLKAMVSVAKKDPELLPGILKDAWYLFYYAYHESFFQIFRSLFQKYFEGLNISVEYADCRHVEILPKEEITAFLEVQKYFREGSSTLIYPLDPICRICYPDLLHLQFQFYELENEGSMRDEDNPEIQNRYKHYEGQGEPITLHDFLDESRGRYYVHNLHKLPDGRMIFEVTRGIPNLSRVFDNVGFLVTTDFPLAALLTELEDLYLPTVLLERDSQVYSLRPVNIPGIEVIVVSQPEDEEVIADELDP